MNPHFRSPVWIRVIAAKLSGLRISRAPPTRHPHSLAMSCAVEYSPPAGSGNLPPTGVPRKFFSGARPSPAFL